jgi:hypothetical protein
MSRVKNRTAWAGAGLRTALGAAGEPGILGYALRISLAFAGGEAGNIAFGAGEWFTVFLLFVVIGDESHINNFL